MSLEYPYLLLLFIPYAAVLYFGWTRRSPSVRVPGLAPFRRAAGGSGRANLRKLIPFALCALGGAAMILAMARPREGIVEKYSREIDPSSSEGIDIMIALDLSPSMDSYDSQENLTQSEMNLLIREGKLKNRVENAKEEITRFIKARPGDRIGLIAFARRPFVISPPTVDHKFLLDNLERFSTGDLRDGTGIARPIVSAVDRLKNAAGKSRIIVLFTDGADNVAAQISPRDAGRLAKQFGVRIYTVGIGSPLAWYPFLNGALLEPYGNEFDEALLKDLAEITGGRYYRASDGEGEDMKLAMDDINKLEKTEIEQPVEYNVTVSYNEYYPYLCWFALGAILLAFCLGRTFCLRLP